jgi:hypothetical protein
MPSPLTLQICSTALLSGESREQLEALLEAYFEEFQPQAIAEERSLVEMVDAEWRLGRLRRHELVQPTLSPVEFRRFERHLLRLYDRALQNLFALRREQRLNTDTRYQAAPKRIQQEDEEGMSVTQ